MGCIMHKRLFTVKRKRIFLNHLNIYLSCKIFLMERADNFVRREKQQVCEVSIPRQGRGLPYLVDLPRIVCIITHHEKRRYYQTVGG